MINCKAEEKRKPAVGTHMLTEILKTRMNIQYYVLQFVSLTHIRLSVNLVYVERDQYSQSSYFE